MVRDRRRWRRRRAAGRSAAQVAAIAAGVALVVVLAIGSIASIAPASQAFHRALARGFAVLATPLALRSTATGTLLDGTVTGVTANSRSALFSSLDQAAADAADESSQMAAAGAPPTARGASQACVAAMAGRAAAAADVRAALEGVLGGPTGTAATAGDEPSALRSLSAAGSLLGQSDASWAACRVALRHQSRAATVPASAWVTDPATWQAGALAAYVSDLAHRPALAPAPRLVILALTTVPPPVLGAPGAGAGVVPPASALVLRVIVSNWGNVDERGVRVSAVATAVGAGPPAGPSVAGTVDIPAGRSMAVTLPPVSVHPGGTYRVLATAGDTVGGASPTASVLVAVAAPPPTPTPTTSTTTSTTRPAPARS